MSVKDHEHFRLYCRSCCVGERSRTFPSKAGVQEEEEDPRQSQGYRVNAAEIYGTVLVIIKLTKFAVPVRLWCGFIAVPLN